MGLMDHTEEQAAKWIWYPENRYLPHTFIYFRKRVEITGEVLSAVGKIAADSRYQLFVNGTRVQRGPAPFDPRHQEWDPIHLEGCLHTGENVIGILVCYFGYSEGTYIINTPGMQMTLDITCTSGSQRIVTDSSWRTWRGLAWRGTTYKRFYLRALQESFDARFDPIGWDTPNYDDSAWLNAKEWQLDPGKPMVALQGNYLACYDIPDDRSFTMTERDIPFLKETREQAMELVAEGRIIWKRSAEEYFDHYLDDAFTEDKTASLISKGLGAADFPYRITLQSGCSTIAVFALAEEMTGFPYVTIKAPEGTVVELCFSESRFPDTLMLPAPQYGTWNRIITRAGVTTFEAFDYEAVKYIAVLVRGEPAEVELLDTGVIRRTYPFANKPDFKCSDDLLNRLHAAAVNTALNVSLETIVDNVARERQQYSGDVGLTKLAHYLGFGDYALPRRMIRTFASGQSVEGWFMDCFPASDRLERLWQKTLGLSYWGPIIDHGMGFLADMYHYVMHSGDRSTLEELYLQFLQQDLWLQSLEDEHGFIAVTGHALHTVWVEHLGYEQERHKHLGINMVYYDYLQKLDVIAAWMGDEALREKCGKRAANLKANLLARYWDAETGAFIDNLPWLDEEAGIRMHDRTASLGLLTGLTPIEHRATSLNHLIACPPELGISHPVNAGYRLMALAEFGKGDAVVHDLRERWGAMNSLWQNNTLSEIWQIKHDQLAWCQCSVAPLYVLYGDVLGIKPIGTGFSKVRIYPQIGDLAYAEGSVPTSRGKIHLHIQQLERTYSMDLTLPAHTEVCLKLPGELIRMEIVQGQETPIAEQRSVSEFTIPAQDTSIQLRIECVKEVS